MANTDGAHRHARAAASGNVSEFPFLQIDEISRAVHSGELSPVELTAAQLSRIDQLDEHLQSFAAVLIDEAMAAAGEAEREIRAGAVRGPLHGIPLAVKDLCWIAGTPTTAGSVVHRDFVPEIDAVVVHNLRAAGAVVLGTTRMTEGAFGQHHPALPTPVNPWASDAWIGFSSSGSAGAVAAGLCYGALGSDAGGSIRYPSAATGVTGLKTTNDLVSRQGTFPLAETLDTIGPMARSAADCALILDALVSGAHHHSHRSRTARHSYRGALEEKPVTPVIGVAPTLLDGVDGPTAAAIGVVVDVFVELGWQVREVTVPDGSGAVSDWKVLTAVEAARAHAATYPSRRQEYGPVLAAHLDLGNSLAAEDYAAVLIRRTEYETRVQQVFDHVDILLSPVTAIASPSVTQLEDIGRGQEYLDRFQRYTATVNMSRNPSLALPCGFTDVNTPIGFQLIGAHGSEKRLLQAGHVFQQVTDFHRHHPDLTP